MISKQGRTLKLVDLFRNRFASPTSSARSPLRRGPASEQSAKSFAALGNISETINSALRRAGLIKEGACAPAEAAAFHLRQHSTANRALAFDHPGSAGSFITRSFANEAGKRDYKLYIPKNYADRSSVLMPLVVMLHGCTQSPDDFAAGTRMNEFADTHGFLVAYPAQAPRANGSKCWNWFLPSDQCRDEGEPAVIAGIAREIAAAYRIDHQRIFVAGLSAGAAMAVILGTTYPDLFSKVGAHSGLAYGAAHDVPSAFQVMRDASGGSSHRHGRRRAYRDPPGVTVPMILFHGDSDSTVDSANAAAIIAQTLAASCVGSTVPTGKSETKIAGGLICTHTLYSLGLRTIVEDWRIHGAGHAWSGGSSIGSFAEPNGPDASGEMVRFFLA